MIIVISFITIFRVRQIVNISWIWIQWAMHVSMLAKIDNV